MLKGFGFEVHDLGRNIKVEYYIIKARETNADVGVSARNSTTTLVQKRVVGATKEAGTYLNTKVIVGGAWATPEHVEKIGTINTTNAMDLIKAIRRLVGKWPSA